MSYDAERCRKLSKGASRLGLKQEDCQFYHTMDLPSVGVVAAPDAKWDLRPYVDDILHSINFRNRSVIEVGPGSGFLTFEMEKRGARVTSIEAPFDHPWDIVPRPGNRETWSEGCKHGWESVTNAWWFAHEKLKSAAQIRYLSAQSFKPQDVGRFDIALMANMLLHNQDPLRIVTNCADVADTVIIVEPRFDGLEALGLPVMQLAPHPGQGNEHWNIFWHFSTKLFENFLSVMGFNTFSVHRYTVPWGDVPIPHFTLVASR